jgi:methanethiol S-methyltransferase
MKRLVALVYGITVYFLFLGTFLYTIGFVGGIGVVKSIDSGPGSEALPSALIDSLLLSAFAIQHSVMARRGFKQQWTRVVPWHVERCTYVLASTLALILVLWQWRPIPNLVWDLSGTAAGAALAVLFWVGWAILFLSTFLINHFELFGLQQVWAYAHGKQAHRSPLRVPLFYRWVRHSLYLGFVTAVWSAPAMTTGHLLFSVATSGYIMAGIYFEERDRVRDHGNAYLEPHRQVPMPIPIGKHYTEKSHAAVRAAQRV